MSRGANNVIGTLADELASALADAMHSFGVDIAETFLQDPAERANGALAQAIRLQAALFFLHLLDRVAFERFGPFQRRQFMDAVLEGIANIAPPGDLPRESLRERYNTAQVRWSAFPKLVPNGGDTWKGTLCWEFAKEMGLKYGGANPVRITVAAKEGVSVVSMLREALAAVDVSLGD
jgi:hypothetical protein